MMQSPGSFIEHFQKQIVDSVDDRSRSSSTRPTSTSEMTYYTQTQRLSVPVKQFLFFSHSNSRSNFSHSSISRLRASACSESAVHQEKEAQKMEYQSIHGHSIFSYSNLVHAISGAAGSVFAISVFYPLDTVRTRLQVDDHRDAKNTFQVLRDIFREEGLNGLYLGWYPVVTALCCSNFIYFYTFNGLKTVVNRGQKKSSPLVDLTLGFLSGWSSMAGTMFASSFVYFYAYTSLKLICLAMMGEAGYVGIIARDLIIAFLAGVVNVLLTTPLWVANTRLKLQGAKFHTSHYTEGKDNKKQYNGIIDCILKIIRREGVQKLWGGTVPSLFLASNPAIQFMIYEALKRYFKKALHVEDLNALMYFLIGAIAKTVATVITYPLQVIQSRLRAGFAKNESSQTLIENILNVIRTRGFGSLYKGMEAKLLQTVLTAALMFLTYEKIAAFIFRLMGMQKIV